MARTNNLTDFLTDVADAIREKKGTSETIQASDFDTEIENLPSGGDVTTITEINNMLVSFENYLDTLVNNYTAYLDEPITIYTPDERSMSFMIQKRSNGKYRIVWSNHAYYLWLESNTSQAFLNVMQKYATYYKISEKVELNKDTKSGSTIYGYYSNEFNNLEDLLLAIQNSNGSGISYSGWSIGFGYSGVLDANWTTPISNLPVFNSDKTTPFINGKVLSHNTTILPINNS